MQVTFFRFLLCLFTCAYSSGLVADNQTATVSTILPGSSLPFSISIQQASWSLPQGIHSYVSAIYKGKWLFLTGRTNGLHGFDAGNDNFPPSRQNTVVYVVDPSTGTTWSKDLTDITSGLSQYQIDLLSVTSAQGFQNDKTLYITGGYGVDTATGTFATKDALSAINIPGLIKWVTNPSPGQTAAQSIRQIFHPLVQVSGGYMTQVTGHSPMLLVFGQNFSGFYHSDSNGAYTQQVRRFGIIDNGVNLVLIPGQADAPNPNYRRRDLNVVPIMKKSYNGFVPGLVALSGVFTESSGAWTVPVEITPNGQSSMADPTAASTFKQGMNNYTSATVELFSRTTNNMYIVVLGGISFGFFQSGTFQTDSELPFINQVTTIQINPQGVYQQYLMSAEYPVILAGSNPLLFGAGAQFMPQSNLPTFTNGVGILDKMNKPTLLGYVVGGIQSKLPNTNTQADSSASPYVFEVILTPQ